MIDLELELEQLVSTHTEATFRGVGICRTDSLRKALHEAYSLGAKRVTARLNDLVTEMQKHSNDHIHDSDEIMAAQAAVEGVCADRIGEAIKALSITEEG